LIYYLKHEFRISADLTDIEYDTSTILKLSTLLSEFELLPSNFQEEGTNKSKGFVLRPKFTTSDNKWVVLIGKKTITISRNLIDDVTDREIEEANSFIETVHKILKVLLNDLKKIGHRVAFNSTVFFGDLSNEKLKETYSRFNTLLPFYETNELVAWRANFASEKTVEISSETFEDVNVITSISTATIEISSEEGLNQNQSNGFNVDVEVNNSEKGDNEARWEDQLIVNFLEKAFEIREEILLQLKERIVYEEH